MPRSPLLTFHVHTSRWWLLIPAGACIGIIIACSRYLSASYEGLKSWYLSLNPCIYRAGEWADKFFSPAVRQSGNLYAVAGIGIALVLLLFVVLQFNRNAAPGAHTYSLFREDAGYLTALYLLAPFIWVYGIRTSVPAFDEVFSAVHCAGAHPFQAASYYMLPNNHILFNVINSFTTAFTSDQVLSGRVLSGAAFAVLIPLLYYWLRDKTGSRPVAAIFCALMLLQFPVWGFSFQARGYSLYLLCAWASFIFLQKYLQNGSRPALVWHSIAVVAGFWTLPTFFLWEAALVVYMMLHMILLRKIDWPLVRAQVIAGASVFLVLLPVFLFSGKAALLENRYVSGPKVPFAEFWPSFTYSFRSTIQYCFSGYVEARNWSYVVLFIIPLLLLPFIRKDRAAPSVAFNLILWVCLVVLVLPMQRFPYPRNLNAHVSFTLAALLLASYAVMQKLVNERWKAMQLAAILLCCAGMALHFVRFNRDHMHDSLYFYQADTRYKVLQDAVMRLPADASVGLSEEGFYWEYLCHQRGLEASTCLGERANFFIKQDIEPLPQFLQGRLEKVDQVDEYEIYKINEKMKE